MPRKKKNISDSSTVVPAKGFNKSQFIRAHSAKTPKEIVELAQEAGHDINVGLVYAVRTQTKANKGKTPGKRGPKPKSAAPSHTPVAHAKNESDHHKKTLRAMCFLIGYESVKTMLDQIFVEISA